MKTRKLHPVQLNFRNEAYGYVFRPVAFRFGYMGELPDFLIEKIQAKTRAIGFTYNHNRGAWIKEDVDDPAMEAQALVSALTECGFVVGTNQFYAGLPPRQSGSTAEALPRAITA